jgi:hypothetical protein
VTAQGDEVFTIIGVHQQEDLRSQMFAVSRLFRGRALADGPLDLLPERHRPIDPRRSDRDR